MSGFSTAAVSTRCQWHYPANVTPHADSSSPLAVLGFTAADETAYRLLLRRAPVEADAIPDLLQLPEHGVVTLLSKLAKSGLVDVRQGTVMVAPPDQALERAVAEEARRLKYAQDQLETVRGMIPELTAESRFFRDAGGDSMALRTIRADEAVETLKEITSRVGGELLWLRPDQWRLRSSQAADRWIRGLLQEGRRSRVIYPARALEDAPESVRSRAELGEHVRILAELPGRLGIIGGTVAMIPHRFDLADDTVLVVEQPSLVASLTMVFESLWSQALVVPGIGEEDETRLSARRLLLSELANGTKDEQIARVLGQSLRTVRRRVADLMDELNASSRFQAGVEAVRRGWL